MSGYAPLQVEVELDVGQGRLIIEALAERPFKTVFELIGKLNRWANEAFGGEAASAVFAFSAPELALTLAALGELPFNRVHRLVSSLKTQLQQALPGAAGGVLAGHG